MENIEEKHVAVRIPVTFGAKLLTSLTVHWACLCTSMDELHGPWCNPVSSLYQAGKKSHMHTQREIRPVLQPWWAGGLSSGELALRGTVPAEFHGPVFVICPKGEWNRSMRNLHTAWTCMTYHCNKTFWQAENIFGNYMNLCQVSQYTEILTRNSFFL